MFNGAIMLNNYAGYCFRPWFEVILLFSEREKRGNRELVKDLWETPTPGLGLPLVQSCT